MTKETTPPYTEAVAAAVDAVGDELVAISRDIHAHPELNYEERRAASLLTAALERHGFEVERGVGGVETAFRGEAAGAGGGPSVGILVEYDALPDVGHGCGHNLLAISTLGAGIAAKAALSSLPGRIVVLGTPRRRGAVARSGFWTLASSTMWTSPSRPIRRPTRA